MPRISYTTSTQFTNHANSFYEALLEEIRQQPTAWTTAPSPSYGFHVDPASAAVDVDREEASVQWSPDPPWAPDPEPVEQPPQFANDWTRDFNALSRLDGWRLRYRLGESMSVVAAGDVPSQTEAERRMWANTTPAGRMARRLLRHYSPDLYDDLSERFDP